MDSTLKEKVEQVLDEKVRPTLIDHEGDIQIIDFSDGILYVRLMGQCCYCPAANITNEQLIKKEMISAVDEIHDVVLSDGITEDMMDFAREILSKPKQ